MPVRFLLGFMAVLFLMAAKPPPEAIQARCAHEQSDQALLAKNAAQKRQHALKGIACASSCLKGDPAQPECYYYRGVNRGLLLETRAGHYKRDITLMIQDFKRTVVLASRLDEGGALRALGYIYLKLPELPIFGADLSRDLELAQKFADQALAVSAEHPDNLKLKGEIKWGFRDYESALSFFERAQKNLKTSPLSPDEKKQLGVDLEKWLERVHRKL